MNKTLIIIRREYLTRVRKKTFIFMTILGPLIMAGLMVVPLFVSGIGEKAIKIHVIDETKEYQEEFMNASSNSTQFEYYGISEEAFRQLKVEDVRTALVIPKDYAPDTKQTLYLHSKGRSTVHAQKMCQLIIAKSGSRYPDVDINFKKDSSILSEDNSEGIKHVVAYSSVVLIYFFIFLYGIQVMKGVVEEKSNRIIEVMISSVRPFQLMMGKIIGLALVGLTQYVIWLVVGISLSLIFGAQVDGAKEVFTEDYLNEALNNPNMNPAVVANQFDWATIGKALGTINFPFVVTCFFIYFIGGYLIYSALFAAIGAASDADTDTQQFTLPVTFPLLLSFLMVQYVISDPNSGTAFWMSQIPFTSPIIMVARIPFMEPSGGFLIELGSSMLLLIVGFFLVTGLAAKIYRVGILMYGKKAGYREIMKWVFYKK